MQAASRLTPTKQIEWNPLNWNNLVFHNRLGIAGGVDKDGIGLKGWQSAGAGFLEIGTITPEPQPGNSGRRVARDFKFQALWNRLGFPSHGVEKVAERLSRFRRGSTPLFANIGKNASTPLDSAHLDYLRLADRLSLLVDGFVINISSPNTVGLRELLQPSRLRDFLAPLSERFRQLRQRWLLKLSPDMTEDELSKVLEISLAAGVDGWVITNTSLECRENLRFPEGGGVSGRPLASRSENVLRSTLRMLGPQRKGRLIVSVGGILEPEDVQRRLEIGADLVQVYAALIFSGPFFFQQVAQWQQKRKLQNA